MTPAAFLRRYWQKRPLLIRAAFPNFEAPISADDLAGVAGEPDALARLVLKRPGASWRVRTGPIAASAFRRLPKRGWTLLVQDCDKWFPKLGQLLDQFRFVPGWRLDDIMASYAVDGASVGAHVDQYDVFLLQAMGRRRWRISTDPEASTDFVPNAPLKLLRRFAPNHEWLLEPGDMLYLPPGVPHHGVAAGACMTFSIGMRAPALGEMLLDFAAAHTHDETVRYADPDLRPSRARGEIDEGASRRAARLLARAISGTGRQFDDWFGQFITRYRSAHVGLPRAKRLGEADVRRRVRRGEVLALLPWARAAYRRSGRLALLFVAGDTFPCSLRCARALAADRRLERAAANALPATDWATLAALANAGHAELQDPRAFRDEP
jgi:50S ribosomal protein L16 3-hydroxylase